MMPPDAPKRTVLVVEDEPLVRLFMADVLEDAGFRVREAVTAQVALAVLEACPEVLVLLTDINMPGRVNGLDLARTVHERWPKVGIIVMSGRVRPGLGELPQGSVFLSKPCPALRLIEEVTAAADRAEAAVGSAAAAPFDNGLDLDIAAGAQAVQEPDRS